MIAAGAVLSDPLIPDGDEAREWARHELADPVYDAAQPTAFDRIAQAIGRFFADLFSFDVPSGVGPTLALVAAGVVVLVIVAAFVVWGVPRATHRARPGETLFGEQERRTAERLRREAESHAARGEWDAAIILRFRALARGTLERGVVEVPPGATVHAYARAAARAYPDLVSELEASATFFDDVRYLRRPGSADMYGTVARTDGLVSGTRPVAQEVPA